MLIVIIKSSPCPFCQVSINGSLGVRVELFACHKVFGLGKIIGLLSLFIQPKSAKYLSVVEAGENKTTSFFEFH